MSRNVMNSPLSVKSITLPTSPLNPNVAGKEYDIVRKNTFLEVVPRESRLRSHSEPAWSRETTPTRKPIDFLEDRSTDIGSSRGGSPAATPTLNTRGTLNSQPAMWQPATFFWQPYVVEGENNMEWNNQQGFDSMDSNMYNGNNMQWMPWNGNNMQYNGYGEDGQFMMMDDHQINGPDGQPIQQWDGPRDGRDRHMNWDERRANMDRERMDRMDKRGLHPGQKRKPRQTGKNGGGGKVFVGGLASKTTEETLMKVFSQYGQVVHASVLVDATSRRSRGFGYVTFQGEVPEHVIDKDHLIDGRMCGARLYKYN